MRKMSKLYVLLCAALLLQLSQQTQAAASSLDFSAEQLNKQAVSSGSSSSSSSALSTVLKRKSRQSRCVRCYEDRYYGSGSLGGGGYSSRSGDERSSWYYPNYDRYDERSYKDRDYNRYNTNYRNDRYTPTRVYDRYENRGYDDYRRGSYDRGYGYDSRDRYANDRYGDYYYGDKRYNARYRPSLAYDRYERDPYDRYYTRYDYRNYRPWDETYRGQSGFDNSGRGYYFANENDDRRYNPQDREYAGPCGQYVSNCPYGIDDERGTRISSGAIDSGNIRGGHTSVIGKNTDSNSNNSQNKWTYMHDQDKQDARAGGGGNAAGISVGIGSGNGDSSNNNNGGNRDRDSRDREQEQQSSAYGGRPPRPLGGSYLFDRDSNAVSEAQNDVVNLNNGGTSMALTAAATTDESVESNKTKSA